MERHAGFTRKGPEGALIFIIPELVINAKTLRFLGEKFALGKRNKSRAGSLESRLGRVLFQGTPKTRLFWGHVYRWFRGRGTGAGRTRDDGRGHPGRAIPRELWGGGSGTVRQEPGWRRRVTRPGKWEPGSGEGRNAGIPEPA